MLINIVLDKLAMCLEWAVASRAYIMVILEMFMKFFFCSIVRWIGAKTTDIMAKGL